MTDPSTIIAAMSAEAFGLMDHLLHHYRIIPPWRVKNPFLPPVD